MSFALSSMKPMMGRTGLGLRLISTSRAAAVQSSKITSAAGVAANETAGFKYIPGGPVLPGTVNDATSFPHSDPSHGSRHWVFERALSAALVPVMGAAVAANPGTGVYPVIDAILATSLIVHSHIGFDSCIIDYLHERKMPVIGFAAKWLLRVATGASIWGVYEFETNDIGLTELVRRLWTA
ncbi:hypothetical protein FFLO_06823 [Filobasidium floriforme]|uniref:Succinate dehydrogenase [ubiquinone] cytochrome b small subunit n=1 Tax=Filobasidium floriforme TaxID=5210 RepID=A0A8K0JEI0_9TREE|nr:mitochondrial inner membrane protein [Filobasidium floriforme]KAG7527555.1 hypothetical protein FFLO_06823 [Filobasidium floriforme]KAH8080949.1 mitochondrial inner membrane protein [Filobasidium floriforme]